MKVTVEKPKEVRKHPYLGYKETNPNLGTYILVWFVEPYKGIVIECNGDNFERGDAISVSSETGYRLPKGTKITIEV